MNRTCFESGDHTGATQHPPVVNCFSVALGALTVGDAGGVAVSAGEGVSEGRAVGETFDSAPSSGKDVARGAAVSVDARVGDEVLG